MGFSVKACLKRVGYSFLGRVEGEILGFIFKWSFLIWFEKIILISCD